MSILFSNAYARRSIQEKKRGRQWIFFHLNEEYRRRKKSIKTVKLEMRMSKKAIHHIQSNGDGGKSKKEKINGVSKCHKTFQKKKKGNASREVVKIDQKYIKIEIIR